MKNKSTFLQILIIATALVCLTVCSEGKMPSPKVVDRGWQFLNKENNTDAAKIHFWLTMSLTPDTFYGGRHLLGLSAVYTVEKNYTAAYYYANRAMKAAKHYKDTVWADLFLGRTCNRINDPCGAIQHVEHAIAIVKARNDTAFITKYYVVRETEDYKQFLVDYNRENVFVRTKYRLYSFGCKTAAMCPVFYPLIGGKILYSYLVFVVLSVLFGLMLLNTLLQKKANIRRIKMYVTYFVYIVGYFIISIITQIFLHYYFIWKGNTDYFTYPTEGLLLYRLAYIGYLLFFVIYERHNKWLILKSVFASLRRKKLLIQISWGVFLYLTMSIALGVILKAVPQIINLGKISTNINTLILYSWFDTVLFAPVFEEILFRWLLYRLARTMSNKWYAIVISYVVFALSHFSFHEITIAKMVFYVVLTITTAIALEKTKSILPAYIVHSLHNLAAFKSTI